MSIARSSIAWLAQRDKARGDFGPGEGSTRPRAATEGKRQALPDDLRQVSGVQMIDDAKLHRDGERAVGRSVAGIRNRGFIRAER
jgi:hypothetical protein